MPVSVREPSQAELDAAMELRRRVFCGEQGVDPDAEFDGLDDASHHLVAVDAERVVGTCRLRELEPGVVKLERMAVDSAARGAGAGRALCEAADGLAAELGARSLVLHAQRRAEAFYAACGYEPVGGTFIEEDIPHVKMTRNPNGGARHALDSGA